MTETTPRRLPIAARLLLTAVLLATSAGAAAAAERAIRVTYVSDGAVYLDAGRADGLAPGARLRLVRDGETVAEVEVDFIAERSSSCRLVSSTRAVRTGDRAVFLAPPPVDALTPTPSAPAEPPEAPAIPAAPLATAYEQPAAAIPWARPSGSLTLSYRTFSVTDGPSSSETGGRLSLRLREIAGKPLTLTARGRGRRIERDGYGRSIETSQSVDRLYDLSLAYAPEAGRFAFRLGRFATGPFAGMGYLDGGLGEMRLGRRFAFGLFGGTRPDLEELGFGSAGSKYGAFVRFATPRDAGPTYAEIVLGGATERARGGDVSRDFVSLESRFGSGSRWWLVQRAEVDLNRGWRRDIAEDSSQVTNAALALSLRLSPAFRLSLDYDQHRNYLTFETRPLPEEVFTRYFREGGRVGLEWRGPRAWGAVLSAGQERARDIDDPTDSASLSLSKGTLFGKPLLLGGDFSTYSGGTAEGWVASLRTRWAFRRGHEVGLTLGASEASFPELDLDARTNEWARLSGTVQLPLRLFAYLEYEVSTGDDLEGDRALVEIGYRF